MDSDNIKILLEKYWDGESTLQEEAQLRSYFNGSNVTENLKPYQPLFQFFHLEHEKHLNEEFDEQWVQRLQNTDKRIAKVRKLPYYLMRVAAACLLLIAVYFVIDQSFSKRNTSIAQDEVLTAEDAYTQTKAALLLVSAKLNKGTNMANKGMLEINKATSVIK